jgi:hypothetical protein
VKKHLRETMCGRKDLFWLLAKHHDVLSPSWWGEQGGVEQLIVWWWGIREENAYTS